MHLRRPKKMYMNQYLQSAHTCKTKNHYHLRRAMGRVWPNPNLTQSGFYFEKPEPTPTPPHTETKNICLNSPKEDEPMLSYQFVAPENPVQTLEGYQTKSPPPQKKKTSQKEKKNNPPQERNNSRTFLQANCCS